MKTLLFALIAICASSFADVTFTEQPGRVRVEIGGQLFTEYHYDDAPRVYYWPLMGPGGVKMTRSYPMENAENEERDHLHHRSLWFSHGSVNGMDFWTEDPERKRTGKNAPGTIKHVKILAKENGAKFGVLQTEQKWMAPDGTVPLRSVQTLRVYNGPSTERMFDFEIALTARDRDVVFGDTKEGTFAMRIAESMRLVQPKGKAEGRGSIVNSEGAKDAKAWGQSANWVAMSGPIGEKSYTITFLSHPSNLRAPQRWHARDYGLFAVNPFCEHDMNKSQPKGTGNYTLKAGETLTLKYRIAITEGDATVAKCAERFAEYSKER